MLLMIVRTEPTLENVTTTGRSCHKSVAARATCVHRWSMWEVSVGWEGLRGAGMEGRVSQVVHVGGKCWLGRAQGSWMEKKVPCSWEMSEWKGDGVVMLGECRDNQEMNGWMERDH